MNMRGFTLIEMVLAVAIMAILTTIGTFSFGQYQRKSLVENQTRRLYVDIVALRSQALFEKRPRTLRLAPASYALYSSDVVTGAPASTTVLNSPVTLSGAADVTYDTSGMTSSTQTICAAAANAAPVDSVVIYPTSIRLGKLNQGAACADVNIVAK
jgi:prepilin-type N-terminal cleavage/methylation domain-containing protein